MSSFSPAPDVLLQQGVDDFVQLLRSNKVALRASVYCCNLIYGYRRYAELDGGEATRAIGADEIENNNALKEVLAGGLRAMKQSQTTQKTTFNMCVLNAHGSPMWNEYERSTNREFWNAYQPMYGDRASFFICLHDILDKPTFTLGEWSE